jgi:hypothetical protein
MRRLKTLRQQEVPHGLLFQALKYSSDVYQLPDFKLHILEPMGGNPFIWLVPVSSQYLHTPKPEVSAST